MSCMEGENKRKGIDLDWNKLLPINEDDDETPEEVVVTTTIAAAKKPKPAVMDESLQWKSESELNELIGRTRTHIEKLGPKLPDKGEKLKLSLKQYEDELVRRSNIQLEKETNECEELTQVCTPSPTGASCGSKQGVPPPIRPSSKFGSLFCSKLEENKDSRTVNAFEEDFRYLNPCDRRRMKLNGQGSARGRLKNGLPSRQKPFQCPSSLSVDVDKQVIPNGDKNGRHSSTCSPRNEDVSGCLSKRNTSQDQPSRNLRPRNGRTFFLVDEEEPEQMENIKQAEQAEKLDESMKEIVVYYPSRDDPESVEISFLDMECLAPEAFLSSPIINFYIRYLQNPTSPSKKTRLDYHFFNTYFYQKLKEAMLSKRNDREALFRKFRRWWKGVNIFEKAYILLPVHENQHWSLVIICFPDKEDESGPILLHLDSLGLHFSRSIFDSIKGFLKEEWNYLRKEEAPSDLPITDKLWQNLPRRMDEKIITVPQQRNDYDCGIFVLFFMERFIEEAPVRLKKKDLEMFGKKWFEPEEASGLRQKIRNLLLKEFKDASEKKRLESEKEKLQSEEIREP